MNTVTSIPSVQRVREVLMDGPVPLYSHVQWHEQFPWLIQGITARGADGFDLGLFGKAQTGAVMGRWLALRQLAQCGRLVHARQVHGARVVQHAGGPDGQLLVDAADGHLTAEPDVLLAITVADCVPIFAVDARRHRIALLHAGWRGIAAGILEAGLDQLSDDDGSRAPDLFTHFGPAICGRCYEVGPEVHSALGREAPGAPALIDLRGILAQRATEWGIPSANISVSSWCTRCDDAPFYSHRAGHEGRQAAILGLRVRG